MANQRKEHYSNTVGLYSVGYNAVADNAGSFILHLLPPKSSATNPAKFSENSNLFKVIQGHQSWYKSKANVRLPVSR